MNGSKEREGVSRGGWGRGNGGGRVNGSKEREGVSRGGRGEGEGE